MKVGLVLQTDEDIDVGRPIPRYTHVRDLACQGEAAGFDSIWLYDHLLYRYERKPTQGTWECWTFLPALAAATKRVEIGTMVACVPFRNPALIAKMATTLDEVSDGRFILGLGAGWHHPEFEAFGLPFDHKIQRFEEAVQIIAPLVREGRVDFDGTYHRATNCEILPRGPRPSGPPLLIGGTGPRLMQLTARYADSWNIGFLTSPEAVIPMMKGVCAEVGRDPTTLEVTVLRILAYPDLTPPLPSDFPDYLTGSPYEIAAALRTYASLGVSHVVLECVPTNTESIDRLSEALNTYRQQP